MFIARFLESRHPVSGSVTRRDAETSSGLQSGESGLECVREPVEGGSRRTAVKDRESRRGDNQWDSLEDITGGPSSRSLLDPLKQLLVKVAGLRRGELGPKELEAAIRSVGIHAVEETGAVSRIASFVWDPLLHVDGATAGEGHEAGDASLLDSLVCTGESLEGSPVDDTKLLKAVSLWIRGYSALEGTMDAEALNAICHRVETQADDGEAALQDTSKMLLRMVEQDTVAREGLIRKQEAYMVETDAIIKQNAEELIGMWIAAVRRLRDAANLAAGRGVELAPSLSECDGAALDRTLEKLLFTQFYVSRFIECSSLLKAVQDWLYKQKPQEAFCQLQRLSDVLENGSRLNGRWVFQGGSRQYLSHKLNFVLELMTPIAVQRLQGILEQFDFGGLLFSTRYDEAPAELRDKQFPQWLAGLWYCEKLFESAHVLGRADEETSARVDDAVAASALPSWVSMALASVVILRFQLLFVSPGSPVARLGCPNEAFDYLRSVVSSHVPCIWAALAKTGIAEGSLVAVKTSFLELVASEVQRFALGRCRILKELSTREPQAGMPSAIVLKSWIEDTLEEVLLTASVMIPECPSSVAVLFRSQPYRDSHIPPYLPIQPAKEQYYAVLSVGATSATLPESQCRARSTDWEDDDLSGLLASDVELDELNVGLRREEGAGSKAKEAKCVHFDSLLELLCLTDADRLLQFFESQKDVSTVTPTRLFFSLAVKDPRAESADRQQGASGSLLDSVRDSCCISQKVRTLVEAIHVLHRKVHPLMIDPDSAQLYACQVYEPVLRLTRFALRDAWNALPSPIQALEDSCLILETFQVVINSFDQGGSFEAAMYLTFEFSEWRRLLALAQKVFIETFVTCLVLPASGSLEYMFLEHPEDCFLDRGDVGLDLGEALAGSWVQRIREVASYINVEPGRVQLLAGLGQAIAEATLSALDTRIHVLYADQQRALAQHCKRVVDLFDGFAFKTLRPLLGQLKDVHILLLEPVPSVREFFHFYECKSGEGPSRAESQSVMPVAGSSPCGSSSAQSGAAAGRVSGPSSFLGVKLMMEAENLLKKSTHQLLRPRYPPEGVMKCPNVPGTRTASHPSTPTDHPLLLKIKEMTIDECCSVLRKRREFCLKISPGFQTGLTDDTTAELKT